MSKKIVTGILNLPKGMQEKDLVGKPLFIEDMQVGKIIYARILKDKETFEFDANVNEDYVDIIHKADFEFATLDVQ